MTWFSLQTFDDGTFLGAVCLAQPLGICEVSRDEGHHVIAGSAIGRDMFFSAFGLACL